MMRRFHRCVAATAAVAILAAVLPATAAAADSAYHVAYTGVGIYPRANADMAAAKVGAALPDGSTVSIRCETVGVPVINEVGHASPIWAQLMDGTWLPVMYLDTPGLGTTPGIPDCSPYPAVYSPEAPYPVSGIRVVSDSSDPDQLQVANQLLDHYFDKSGDDVAIDWHFFERDEVLMRWARALPADSIGQQYVSDPNVNGRDFYLALGKISFARTSEHCFVMRDTYDFDPRQYPTLWLDAHTGAAKTFQVRASGCEF